MAITISGENNNDRILAQDGVIDSISGINIAGIITASSFTGDLTGRCYRKFNRKRKSYI